MIQSYICYALRRSVIEYHTYTKMETNLELTLWVASLLLSPLLGTSALLVGAQVFFSSDPERLELHERKYTNYCLYVTQINSTVDYMKLITVFYHQLVMLAVVSVISECTIYASVGVSKNSMNKHAFKC